MAAGWLSDHMGRHWPFILKNYTKSNRRCWQAIPNYCEGGTAITSIG